MKKLFIGPFAFIVSVSIYFSVYAQQDENVFYLRTYNHSLSLVMGGIQQDKHVVNSYGNEVLTEINLSSVNRYLFQAHEYAPMLGLYLFPFRTYDTGKKRFYETDPASQYFSPYLFVGGDPINNIDPDGMKGKALVLYQEEHMYSGNSINSGTADLKAAVPDAHYVPMSDFINQKVGPLEDWNGRVFIKSHLGDTPGREIMSETSRDMSAFKTVTGDIAMPAQYSERMGTNILTADGEKMGRLLRRFSEERSVPIKSVVAGGCRGVHAAKALRDGFMAESKSIGLKGKKIKFKGTKGCYTTKYLGKNTHEELYNDIYPEGMRYYVSPIGYHDIPNERLRNGKTKFTGYRTKLTEKGRYKADPYAGETKINEMVSEGRIPGNLKSYFQVFKEIY